MGLSAPKRREKISEDPNNTTWSRSTERFGHRILTERYGWKPGEQLGAKDTAYGASYGSATAGHIRVVLKDNNAGLGAERAKDRPETFGLNGFQALLGRLNGKSEVEVQKEERTRRDVQLRLYVGQRYTPVAFVSGGFLVGDKIEPDNTQDNNERLKSVPIAVGAVKQSQAKERKREREDDSIENQGSSKRIKHNKALASSAPSKSTAPEDHKDDSSESDREKAKEAKRALRDARSKEKEQRRQRKAERHAKREQRRHRKEEQKARSLAKVTKGKEMMGCKVRKSSIKAPTSSESEVSGDDPPQVVSSKIAHGRQTVRQRYIQQKRMASMDTRALNEASDSTPAFTLYSDSR
ncbi:MAG: hypothetical protein M1820_000445 [Bogoriella megaspora]|nr:MAG: hypothetical protein M1820_000445 [Bogoriella megaspora]